MRTALLLLALLALAAIPGTVIPQTRPRPGQGRQLRHRRTRTSGRCSTSCRCSTCSRAPWFAAIYLLLFISLVGCLVPRIRLHARALRRRPPNAPRHLHAAARRRPTGHASEPPDAGRGAGARRAAPQRWRADVRREADGVVTVAAEKGYLRETGNLVFHVALLVLLAGIALGGLFGYKGTVLVDRGRRLRQRPRALRRLPAVAGCSPTPSSRRSRSPWSDFTAQLPANGEPTQLQRLRQLQDRPDAPPRSRTTSRVNHPLEHRRREGLPGRARLRAAICGHQRAGQTVYDGDTPFLPDNAQFASHGVVKVPDLGRRRAARPDRVLLPDGRRSRRPAG